MKFELFEVEQEMQEAENYSYELLNWVRVSEKYKKASISEFCLPRTKILQLCNGVIVVLTQNQPQKIPSPGG